MNKAIVAKKESFSYEARISALLDSDSSEPKVDYFIVDSSMLVNIAHSINSMNTPICNTCNTVFQAFKHSFEPEPSFSKCSSISDVNNALW